MYIFLETKKIHIYLCCMEEKKSIINWEVYSRLKKNPHIIKKDLRFYRKPLLGRILDNIRFFGKKMWKKPVFSILFLLNLTLLLEYGRCSYFGDHIDLFRWVTTGSFLVFFGYLTFFDKN